MLLIKPYWGSKMFKQLLKNRYFHTNYPWEHFPYNIHFTRNPHNQTIFIGIDSYFNAGHGNNLVISSINDLNNCVLCNNKKDKLNVLLTNSYIIKKDKNIESYTAFLLKLFTMILIPDLLRCRGKYYVTLKRSLFCVQAYDLLSGLKKNLVGYIFNTNRINVCYSHNFYTLSLKNLERYKVRGVSFIMKKLLLNITFLAIISPIGVFADSYAKEQRIWNDAASMGMGGVGVSTYGYRFSAIRNPAMLGLMSEHTIIPFIDIGLVMNPGMMGLIKTTAEVLDGHKDYTQIDYDSMVNRVANVGFNGPLSVGVFGKGLGVWTTSSSDFSFVFKLPNHPLVRNISLNSLVSTSKEVLDLVGQSGGDVTKVNKDQLANILTNRLLEIFIGSGKSKEDALEKVNHLINKFAGTTGKNYINGTDTIPPTADISKLDPKDLLPLASLTALVETTANIGYGYQIRFAGLDDVSGLAFGGTFRFSQRFKISEKETDIIDLGDRYSQNTAANIYQGQSFSSDFGTALRIQNWVAAIAVRDAFSTPYKWKPLDGKISFLPDSQIPISLDFGTSYKFLFKNKFIQEIGMYFEFQDTLNKMTDWGMKIRTGMEFKLFNFLDLRFGMYDLFPTAGIGIGWKWARMDFAYYRKTHFSNTPLAFYSDQLYLNFSLGLDNTPTRKKATKERKAAKAKARKAADELIQVIIDNKNN